MTSDILIIGGGVIGLATACELKKRGAGHITLIEKDSCGEEASWAAAGMLGVQAEADDLGPFFTMCSASRDLYPELADELLDTTGIDIELDRRGTLYLAFSDQELAELERRFRTHKNAGLDVELLPADEIRRAEPFVSPDVRGGLFFANDWQVDNRKLVAALRRRAETDGVKIIENKEVTALVASNNRILGVETNGGRIFARETILATGAWTSLIQFGDFDMPFAVEPVRGQIVAFKTAKRLFEHVLYGRDGYLVPRADGRILAGSTSEHVGFEKDVTAAAEKFLREMASGIAPSLASLATADHWAGLRPFAKDGMPIIGGFDGVEGLTVATAHYRNGILLAPLTAKLVADRVLDGADHEYQRLYGPDRFRLRSVGTGS